MLLMTQLNAAGAGLKREATHGDGYSAATMTGMVASSQSGPRQKTQQIIPGT